MNTDKTIKFALTAVALGAAGAHAAPVTTPVAAGSSFVTVPAGTITFTTFDSLGTVFDSTELSASASSVSSDTLSLGDVVSAGTLIDSNFAFSNGSPTIIDKTGGLPTINLGTDLMLPFESTVAGQSSFGYVTFDASENADTTFAFKLDSVTYDASGAGVVAGAVSAVPEPASLTLMAAGALGLVAFRRRRQQASRA